MYRQTARLINILEWKYNVIFHSRIFYKSAKGFAFDFLHRCTDVSTWLSSNLFYEW